LSILYGDSLVWTLLVFGGVLWIMSRLLTGEDNFLGVACGAVLLAVFGTNVLILLSANALVGLAVIAMIVLLAQYLTDMTLAESIVVLLVAWIVGIYFIQIFIW
jgi:hypothetical protein